VHTDEKAAMTLAGFTPVAEVTADDRARVTIGKAGVRSNDRFLVSTHPNGEILLTPMTSIPKRELIVWENEQVRTSLLRGMAQADAGRTIAAGDLLEGG
jgi:hypothetical protein